MRSVVLSLLLCTLCIHQGYSKERFHTDFTNIKACLAEQKLDLSVFGFSDWEDWEDDRALHKLKDLDESKRNILLACLWHHKPIYSWAPIIIKGKDGKYQVGRGDSGPSVDTKCKAHADDLIKFAGCFYDTEFKPKSGPAPKTP